MKDTIATYLAGEAASYEILKVLRRIWEEVMRPSERSFRDSMPKLSPLPKDARALLNPLVTSFELTDMTIILKTEDRTDWSDYSFELPRHIIESENPIPSAREWAVTYFTDLKARVQAEIAAKAAEERARDLAHFEMLKKRFEAGTLGEVKS